MKLRLAYIDENGNEVTDLEVIEQWMKEQQENFKPETITLTEDTLPRPGHGLPPYIPGFGWITD